MGDGGIAAAGGLVAAAAFCCHGTGGQRASQNFSFFGGLLAMNDLHSKRFARNSSCNADETGYELRYVAVTAR